MRTHLAKRCVFGQMLRYCIDRMLEYRMILARFLQDNSRSEISISQFYPRAMPYATRFVNCSDARHI